MNIIDKVRLRGGSGIPLSLNINQAIILRSNNLPTLDRNKGNKLARPLPPPRENKAALTLDPEGSGVRADFCHLWLGRGRRLD